MFPLDVLGTFLAASLILAATPGPDNIFVLTQSTLYGARAGLAAMFGMLTGIFGHTALVALGVAAVFQTSAFAFNALRFVGAGYLLYLAWLSFRSGAARTFAHSGHFSGYAVLYRRGMFMSLTNPKLTLFFLAFLPQFADPERGAVGWQILQLGALFMVATLLTFGSFAVFAGWIGGALRRSARAQRALNRAAAVVFAALAARLAFASR